MKTSSVVQYAFDIIGVRDFSNTITEIKEFVNKEFANYNLKPILRFINFIFDEDKIEDLKSVLSELSKHYNANLNVDRIFNSTKQRYRGIQRFQIMIVGIFTPILVLDNEN